MHFPQAESPCTLAGCGQRQEASACRTIEQRTEGDCVIKAIVMDMDGTLLSSDNSITEKTRQTLLEAQKQGIRLILASGRSYTRLLKYARELQMDQFGGDLIEVDGIALYDTGTGTRRKLRTMDADEIREVYGWLTKTSAESQAVFDDGLFDFIPRWVLPLKEELRAPFADDPDYPWTAGPWGWLQDLRDGYPKITYVTSADELSGSINKIQIMQEEKPLQEIFSLLQQQFGEQFSIYRTTPRQLEILPLGYSKGKALEILMEENGWKPEEVAAFGDGENDVPLFETAGHSFAMANARNYVREKAAAVCPDHDHDGIAAALQTLLKQENGLTL